MFSILERKPEEIDELTEEQLTALAELFDLLATYDLEDRKQAQQEVVSGSSTKKWLEVPAQLPALAETLPTETPSERADNSSAPLPDKDSGDEALDWLK